MSRKSIIALAIVCAIVVAAVVTLGARLRFLSTDRIAPKVFAASTPLGNLTKAQAADRLRGWARNRLNEEIRLEVSGRRWTGKLGDFGILVDTDKMVQDAYAIGRTGGLRAKLAYGLTANEERIEPADYYRFNRKTIDSALKKAENAVTAPAKDAKIAFTSAGRVITPEVVGTAIDYDRSFESVRRAVVARSASAELYITRSHPKITAESLKAVDTVLSSFTTTFSAWRIDRTHNLKLAAGSINGIIVPQGQVFSYNDTVGPRMKSTGFKEALVYVKGKIIPGIGGGICQVSSTLYNAALLADLEIVERSNHSMSVPYVPLGRDATVAYGLIDLKFRNTTSAPIYISSAVSGNRLTFSIYGASADKKEVKIVQSAVKRSNNDVRTVSVYKIVSANGSEIARNRLSTDRYQPTPPAEQSPKPKTAPEAPKVSVPDPIDTPVE